MLIHFKIFNQTLAYIYIYIYQNHFIFISKQIYFNYFHSDYQITNNIHLSGTLQIGG